MTSRVLWSIRFTHIWIKKKKTMYGLCIKHDRSGIAVCDVLLMWIIFKKRKKKKCFRSPFGGTFPIFYVSAFSFICSGFYLSRFHCHTLTSPSYTHAQDTSVLMHEILLYLSFHQSFRVDLRCPSPLNMCVYTVCAQSFYLKEHMVHISCLQLVEFCYSVCLCLYSLTLFCFG